MTFSPSGLLIRAGLELGDAVFGLLPTGAAYGLTDLLGRAWYRLAPARRRLVAANLSRVVEATGRPLRPAALRRLVRDAFVAHARYYLEIVRMPRQDRRRIDDILVWNADVDIRALARTGGIIAVSAHYGNFEPAAIWIAARGIRWVAPMERIEPPALFDYLISRRGARSMGGEMVVPPAAGRRVLEALRRHELVGIAADREVGGNSVTVTFFGHPARLPSGPATLALLTGSAIVVGILRRTAPGHFVARVERLEWTATGDRQADVVTITQRIADRLAAGIAEEPEQWWGAFQPVWDDLTTESVTA